MKKTDHIHLFYTENAKKISLDFFEDHGEAELVIHKVPVRKQSLDMHLVSFLGYLIGQNPEQGCVYRIVSKDTDYDNILKFWKQEKEIDGSRIANLKSANRVPKARKSSAAGGTLKATAGAKATAGTKTIAGTKSGAGAKAASAKSGETDGRTRLNNEVQQVLSKEGGYTSEVVCDVAKLSVGMLGEEHFQQKVHNELQNRYDNYSDIYLLIKPVLDRNAAKRSRNGNSNANGNAYGSSSANGNMNAGGNAGEHTGGGSNPESEQDSFDPKDVNRMELNSIIQKALGGTGLPPEDVGFVASTVVKNTMVKNGKQVAYRSILSKFGRKQGLEIYRTVKKHIPY